MKYAKINNRTFWGYLFLAVISFMYSFLNTDFEIQGMLSTAIVLISLVLFSLFLISGQHYPSKMLIIMISFVGCGICFYLLTKETVFLIMLMAAVIASRLPYTEMFQLIFWERLGLLCFVVMMSMIGILPTYKLTWIKGGNDTATTAYGLGFEHPNQLAYQIGFLVLIYLCYKNKSLKWKHIFFTAGIGIAGYWVTRSRTFLMIMCFILILLALCQGKKTRKIFNKVFLEKQMVLLVMPFCMLFSIGGSQLITRVTGRWKTILDAVNQCISGRFIHGFRAMECYPITAFGGVSTFERMQVKYGYSVVDNGYIHLLYNFGVVGVFLFLVFYFFAIKKLIKKRESVYLIAVMAIFLWGIMENVLRSFAINFTVVFWSECILEHRSKNEQTI